MASTVQAKTDPRAGTTKVRAPRPPHAGRVVQRVALAMGNDQLNQVNYLGEHGWYFSTEQHGLFNNFVDFRTNNDNNITLWGHAGQYDYGGYTAEGLVTELIKRHMDESGHTVLEILGCAPNLTDNKSEETYAQKVQLLLDNDQRLKRKIQVKSYPMPKPGESSTDCRFDKINKFVYIYGSEKELNEAKERLKTLWKVYVQNNTVEEWTTLHKKFIKYLKEETGLTYKTDSYANVRKYLEDTHVIKTHKEAKGVSKESGLTELLLQDVY